jgi:TonB-linked SusC/RagA family outer membrane protein
MCTLSLFAQQSITVTGTVTGVDDEIIAGVNIVEKGVSNGVMTDANGNFTLNVSANAVLQVSFMGYITQEVSVASYVAGSKLEIKLMDDTEALDEVVVVGYGTQKKVNLTGAVAQITSRELENRPVTTVSQMIQGAMPNVQISISTGAPGEGGAVQIRGTGSLNGSEPLVLIDGIPGSLNRLNPSDVESISVLKDAASSAIYGARGAFGVILVTTKQAKAGKTRVSYDGYVAVSTSTTRHDFLTTGYDFIKMADASFYGQGGRTLSGYTEEDMAELEARRNDKTENPARPWVVVKPLSGTNTDIYHYYGNWDWYDYLYKEWRPSQYHNVNISGGAEKVNYMISASYTQQDGILEHNTENNQVFTVTSKINAQLTPWLKLTNNIVYYNRKYTYPGQEGGTNDNFTAEWQSMPFYAPVNPDGTFPYNTRKNSYGIADGKAINLLDGKSKGQRGIHELKETFMLELDITKDLQFKADYSFQFYVRDDWYRRGISYHSIEPGIVEIVPNFNTDFYKKTMSYDPMHSVNAYLAYNKSIASHTVSATAGVNYETLSHYQLMGQKYDLISSTLNDLNLGTGTTLAEGGQYAYELFGAFFRVNYDYKSRYLLEIDGRYDGTSRFKKGKRFGFFPSVSAGWRVSEEEWFAFAKEAVNNLKIRASYGSLGNQVSGSNYYPYISSMSAALSNYLIDNAKIYSVGLPAPIAENLTWEKATTSNVGIDISLLKNRLSFSADYYVRNTTGMLVSGLTVPAVFGADSPQQNAGDMVTKGFEFVIGWKDHIKVGGKPLNYSVNLSLGDATSEVTKYEANDNKLVSTYYVGQKLGEIWGYRTDGLFQSDQEATEWVSNVNQRYVNGRIYSSPGEWGQPRAGDLKYLDLNGDKQIHPGASTVDNPGDRVIIGNSTPRYNYGINLGADWNGIDFSVFFQGVMHQDAYPHNEMCKFWGFFNRPYVGLVPKDFYTDVWREDNKDAYFPQIERGYAALAGNQLGTANDRYLQNIGYIRLKNLVIGYTLPEGLTKKIRIEKLRIYASGENLWYYSPFRTRYIDPEEVAGVARGGGMYPLSKTLSVGINVTF